MTLALAWNLMDYAIVAADTRVTWYRPDGAVTTDDSFCKVLDVPAGIVTGAGSIQVLDPMMRHLQSMPQSELPLLYAKLVEIETNAVAGIPQGAPGRHHVAFTGLLMASATQSAVAVAVLQNEDGFQPLITAPGHFATLMPDAGTAAQMAPYETRMMESARRRVASMT
jgi:hypothetical protein